MPHDFVERLEPRRLLAAVHPNILNVSGTDGNDTIIITASAKNYVVNLNGVKHVAPVKTVSGIAIGAGAGDDRIRLRFTKFTPKFLVTIDAGDGNDVVAGDGERDYILGGPGNDSLSGNGGNDYLYGDAGDDTLLGGDGNDTLGGDSEDNLSFSDLPTNTPGNDSLNGGAGNDWLLGGLGNNIISYDNGMDTFVGGSGKDILDSRDDNDKVLDKGKGDFTPRTDVRLTGQELTHTHAILHIRVKDTQGVYHEAFIPADIGMFHFRTSALHTHTNDPGRIHFESALAHDTYKLKEFFQVWGISLSATNVGRFVASPGRSIIMTVNGKRNKLFGEYSPKDQDQIVIKIG